MINASQLVAPPHEPYADEAALVGELRERSPEAWAYVYDRYLPRLQAHAFLMLKSREEAEDVASTVFLRALHSIDSFRDQGKPLVAWLFGIAKNVVKEKRRESLRSKIPLPLIGGRRESRADVAIEDKGMFPDRIDLAQAMARLTDDQREVFGLRHIGDMSVKEIAVMLGKSERAVYYLEARAIRRLRNDLDPDRFTKC